MGARQEASGSSTRTVSPPPGVSCTDTRPRCAPAIAATIARPRPEPPDARLREELQRRAAVPVRYPPLVLCTDNAAMIAAAAFYRFDSGLQSGWDLDVAPNLKLT